MSPFYSCLQLPHVRPQPVHASGRYYRHSLVEILRHDLGFEKIYSASYSPCCFSRSSCTHVAINRLDRLTSGLLIIPLNADLARSLTSEFMNGSVRKEYVARCKGEFPVCVSLMNMDIFNMLMY